MLSLPEPGLLQKGVALYKEDKRDEAEYEFKKLLHHIPDHAAASHMVGLIYARKGHLNDAITLMEKSVTALAPGIKAGARIWCRPWRWALTRNGPNR